MKNSNVYAGYRDIEELLAARGVVVSYETIRFFRDCWGVKSMSQFTAIK
ncbi:hypothetical protein [Vibrio navarrensis]|nr:hypothetical protein [Vibrio navarrensis]